MKKAQAVVSKGTTRAMSVLERKAEKLPKLDMSSLKYARTRLEQPCSLESTETDQVRS